MKSKELLKMDTSDKETRIISLTDDDDDSTIDYSVFDEPYKKLSDDEIKELGIL